MRVVASAPAKAILFGEHFVVKGSRAIATALSLRAQVIVEEVAGDSVVIESESLSETWRLSVRELRGESREEELFASLLRALVSRGFSIIPHRAVIKSEIPVAAGLGSSASVAVAYALAYSRLHGSTLNERELFEVTLESEKVAHGRPSGIDNTIAIRGGTIAYRRGEEPSRVNVNIDKLSKYPLIVMDTGVKRSTRVVVEHALSLAERNWSVLKHVYEAAEALVSEAMRALEEGNAEKIGELMNINHGLLSAIGVSSLELDSLVNKARLCGAIGAKLTGAGWGGSAIAIALADHVEAIVDCVKTSARRVLLASIHSPGAKIEESDNP
ncbi:MAG: mevalonate kinase [Acidilobaceae archaeon]